MGCCDFAAKKYAELGIDVDSAIETLDKVAVSLHCWQGDDVGGFEHEGAALGGGGIQVTGNYPGKARGISELKADLEKVFSLMPGKKRINLHAIYGDFKGKFFDRDKVEPEHFDSWIEWAKKNGLDGIDFNGTFFSHPLQDKDGYTLASKDPEVRKFWIEHERKCRKIADYIGEKMGSPCIIDTWIPDGAKDYTADKFGHRLILKESLDEIFKEKYPASHMKDALETKLWGIGSEAFVVGSHEFYLEYVAKHPGIMCCIDMGHFHTAEDVSDKLSSLFVFEDEILMHISRPMRWDSDHVVVFDDNLLHVAEELVRSGKLAGAHLGLDFFDASINRIGAWTIGARALQKALLYALLEPTELLRKYEAKGKGFEKLALMENMRTMPFGAVWNAYCEKYGVVKDSELIEAVEEYEKKVQSARN